MQKTNIGHSDLLASRIGLGLMRSPEHSATEIADLLKAAFDNGIDFFDNADVYTNGEAERRFGEALKLSKLAREDIVVQTKVGINKDTQTDKRYDFTKDHILQSVNGSLQRMGLDYIDILLLHRPDPLMEPEEVAEAFNILQNEGKVRRFGVSNFNPLQVELVQSALDTKLVANQLQLSLMHTGMIDFGMHVNMTDDRSVNHDGSILEYSRLKQMTIQAWSPFQYGFFAGVFIDNPKFPELNELLQQLANKYHTNKNAIATAWILRIPGSIQVIAGTMNPKRLAQIAEGDQVKLTAQEWYNLYYAAGNDLP
ncbi:aldo/keto reductase [Agrilactobacillus fermenti]|uniref:aldo/keto reductase n=1 Tax=Agrilactobacillus fermenti TaxID=2586909 RepID=UPI003A5BE6D4